jgi:hypothetical protein
MGFSGHVWHQHWAIHRETSVSRYPSVLDASSSVSYSTAVLREG